MEKDNILNHVDELTSLQLFDAIKQGIVTLEELRNSGNLDASKRNGILKLQSELEAEDDNSWNNARYTEQSCRDYLTKFPAGKYVNDARKQIDYLELQRNQENVQRNKIVEKVRNNPNSFTSGMLRQYLNDNIITIEDIVSAGIPIEVIDRLDSVVSPQLKLGETPDKIPDGFTEVYFWGIPGSGKTCALAAILSTAEKEGYLEIAHGPGFDYMLKLKNIFSNSISYLPAPSPVDTTQYLPFTLKHPDEKNYRSISLIELSGEIFQCFLLKNANKSLPSTHENTFNTLINFLNGSNRKIHFFFVDYEVENSPDADGYCQVDYLNAAATFFNNKHNNFFSKTTDAIYIVITKSDLMPCEKSDRVNHLKEYLKNNNYNAFVNSLRAKCKENSINAKRIIGTPFDLGQVFFKNMCVFDSETSKNIIDILLRRIEPKKENLLDIFNE